MDDQTPEDPAPPVADDFKMPEVSPKRPDIRSFPKGVAHNTESSTSEPSMSALSTRKPTALELRVKREDRRRQAFEMALDHVPYREIAAKLGCNVATAHRAAEAYRLAQASLESVDVERKRDLAIREHRRNAKRAIDVYNSSNAGYQAKMMAVSEITKSILEVSRLEGTIAPVKVASTTPDGKSWAPLAVQMLVDSFSVDELQILERAERLKLMPGQVVDAEKVG